MCKQPVPDTLYDQARKAADNLYQYECMERFALKTILESAGRGEPVSRIFIDTARTALDRHPVEGMAH